MIDRKRYLYFQALSIVGYLVALVLEIASAHPDTAVIIGLCIASTLNLCAFIPAVQRETEKVIKGM